MPATIGPTNLRAGSEATNAERTLDDCRDIDVFSILHKGLHVYVQGLWKVSKHGRSDHPHNLARNLSSAQV